MESTAQKGVWTERLPQGYKMKVDTNINKFTIFSPSQEEILLVEVPGGIYPRDVVRVRAFAIVTFKITHPVKEQPCQN